MRKAQEEQTQEKLRKERFEKASMRFGHIQNIEDIDQAIEDLDNKHSNLLQTGKNDLSVSKVFKSARFGAADVIDDLENLQKKSKFSILKESQSKIEEDTELQRMYTELTQDSEIKNRLLIAYGPRIAPLVNNSTSYQKLKLEEFYMPVGEDKQLVLNSKLNAALISQVPEAINYGFMQTHEMYSKRYRKFLNDQKYSDGLYRQILKEVTEIKAMRKILTSIPNLDQPKIFATKADVTKDLLNIKVKYKQKMDLVSNEFLKYDISNDNILEEVGRFLEYDGEVMDSESVVEEPVVVKHDELQAQKRKVQQSTGLVDQLLDKVNLNNLRKSQSFAPQGSILKNSASKKNIKNNARFGV